MKSPALSKSLIVVSAFFSLLTSASDIEVVTVTGSRHQTKQLDVSAALGVIDQGENQLVGHNHVNQILSRIPGTWISRGNGQEHLTALRSPVLTGAGACGAFFMAEDGISLRAPGFCNLNQLFDVNSEQAAQIEVLRGPGSILFGSNAVHGSINFLTPDALNNSGGQVAIETGANDYWRGSFQIGHHAENQGFLAYGNVTTDGGYQDESGFEQQKANLIHQYAGDSIRVKSVFSASHLNQETAGFIRGLDVFRDDELRRSNPNPEAYRDSESWRAYSRIDWQFSDTATVMITPYARYADMEFLQHFLPWQPTERNRHHSIGVKSQYHWANDSAHWFLGVDVEHTQGRLTQTQDEPFAPPFPQGEHYDYGVDARTVSPFLDSQWQLSEDLRLDAGIRYDHTRYDYDNRLSDGSACAASVSNCRFTRPADQIRSFGNWSPRAALNYSVNDSQRVFFQVSQGFRAPQTTELFRLQAGQVSADLNAERIDNAELGWKGEIDALTFDLSLYHMRKRNVIFQDTERQNISGGRTEHQGIEASADYRVLPQWTLSMAASYARHRYDNALTISRTNIRGLDIDTAPRRTAQARLTWQPLDNLLWELEWLHLGDYQLNPENTAEYPGHNLFHLRGRYAMTEQLSLTLRVNNLADRDYAERADFAFGDYRYFVGRPREAYLELRYRFAEQ